MRHADTILSAIRQGHVTAPAIADATGLSRNTVSVVLYKMADRLIVRRGRTVFVGPGRSPIQWQIAL